MTMENHDPAKPKIGIGRRRAVSLAQEDLVELSPLRPEGGVPLLARPAVPGVELAAWAADNRQRLEELLDVHGGILFRGFELPTVDDFQAAVQAISGDLLEYKERSSPRHTVSGRIYTSTDYPPDQPIFLHNENSYQHAWPMRIYFFCAEEAEEGGETPLADVRRVYQKIDPEVRRRFVQDGWMYVRNFGDGFGLPWPTVFQTEDPAVVEEHCRKNGITVEWKGEGRLRTRAVRPAAVPHPRTHEMVWFNHATFFHVSTLIESVRRTLLAEFGEEDLPTNTFYGDGTPIEPEVLDHLRAVYAEETIRFPWRRGDLLMLDNMMVAHGRAPFRGRRKVLVAMADPCNWSRFGE
jgi:alpha-ketoglutarate-dependent taurine dioxygenase